MGIDAEMFARTKKPVTDEEILAWAYRLGEAFGADKFFIQRQPDSFGPSHHCLSRVERWEQDGDDIEPELGETFIRVHLWTRYYGPQYERGDLPFILAVAEWLERNIDGAEVWYGGDSSGVCADRFGPAERETLLAHFCRVGHEPYSGKPGDDSLERGNPDRPPAPFCALCQRPLVRYGWGGGNSNQYQAWGCRGCGWTQVTRDGGGTWTEEKEGR